MFKKKAFKIQLILLSIVSLAIIILSHNALTQEGILKAGTGQGDGEEVIKRLNEIERELLPMYKKASQANPDIKDILEQINERRKGLSEEQRAAKEIIYDKLVEQETGLIADVERIRELERQMKEAYRKGIYQGSTPGSKTNSGQGNQEVLDEIKREIKDIRQKLQPFIQKILQNNPEIKQVWDKTNEAYQSLERLQAILDEKLVQTLPETEMLIKEKQGLRTKLAELHTSRVRQPESDMPDSASQRYERLMPELQSLSRELMPVIAEISKGDKELEAIDARIKALKEELDALNNKRDRHLKELVAEKHPEFTEKMQQYTEMRAEIRKR